MEQIKGIIGGLLERWQKIGTGGLDVEGALQDVFGKKALRHIRIVYLRQDEAGIAVDSPVWLYLANLKRRQVFGRLAGGSGAKIKKINFFLDNSKKDL